ncbi:NAD-P-binding protein [Laetiporus sulphureus 93-53]|uniref:NAD-P-binding protein n=1 Tax=Laetiporus sulphureus 93-53 TaxID=1314785 RepID=A0A165ILV4_9APHY|nr:NAD-P-binding protein [Laetiporus sulphureus 93-53]KZT13260.1 NAD-P-binding protein [Laetiporus sulphureus 93-53]
MGIFYSKGFTPDELPDLTGKVIIVTGGNAGIGYATTQHLARHGAKVYMAARNEERARKAIDRLHAAGLGPGNGEVIWLPLDYANPRLAKNAAEAFLDKEERLDAIVKLLYFRLLVPYAKSYDGRSDLHSVSYLSPAVFVQTLLPLLKRTAQEPNSDVRIVFLSSQGHALAPAGVRFRRVDDFNMEFKGQLFSENRRYCLSKYMGALYVKELQKHLDEEGSSIIVMFVHPGVVNSEGVQQYAHSSGPILAPIYSFIARALFTTPGKGAYSTVFAVAAPIVRAEPRKYRGAYIVPPGKLGTPGQAVNNQEVARELWETTEQVLKDIGARERHVEGE